MSNYLIVGASSGIGKALATHLAKSGHHVFGTFNTHEVDPDHPLITYNRLNVLDEALSFDFLPDTLSGYVNFKNLKG